MGSGFRTFTAGEVLTASNVQNYLQDQVVMTFAGSAARSSAIGTANFEEGMVSYLTDTDKVEAYNGTNWVQVGSSNQGLTLINTTSFSGVASQSINDVFSANYNVYKIMLDVSTSVATSDFNMRLRVGGADTSTSIYRRQYVSASSTTLSAVREVNISSWLGVARGENSRNSSNDISVYNPFETVPTTAYVFWSDTNAGNINGINQWFGINDLVSYTGFTILCTSNMTGSISVYGFNQ